MNMSAFTVQYYRYLRFPITYWPLYMLVIAFPFFSVEPRILRPDWWAGTLLILIFSFVILLRGKIKIDLIGKMALGFHGAVLLSLAANFWDWDWLQLKEFFTFWIQLVFATLLYFALANTIPYSKQLRYVFQLWIGVAFIVALYGLYQVLARNFEWPLAYLPYLHPEPERLPSGLAFAGYVRPSSFLREPTYLGMYLLGPTLFTAILFFTRQDKKWLFRSRRLNAIVLTTLLLTIVASFALAAYITLGVLLSLSLLFNRRLRKPIIHFGSKLIVMLLVFLLVSKLLQMPFSQAIEERLVRVISVIFPMEVNPPDPSAQIRLYEAIIALKTWLNHPIIGVGLNQLQFVNPHYIPADTTSWQIKIAERGYTHNMWLAVLAQVGVVGFLFFMLIWFHGLRMMYLAYYHAGWPLKGLALGVFYVLLDTMIRGTMGGPFIFPLYWFYLGLASMIYRLYGNENRALVLGQY